MNAKQIGPLFSLCGMIGTSAEQIMSHPEMPKKLVRQAEFVRDNSDEAIAQVEKFISDATLLKWCLDGPMGEYEERLFKVADAMVSEVAA